MQGSTVKMLTLPIQNIAIRSSSPRQVALQHWVQSQPHTYALQAERDQKGLVSKHVNPYTKSWNSSLDYTRYNWKSFFLSFSLLFLSNTEMMNIKDWVEYTIKLWTKTGDVRSAGFSTIDRSSIGGWIPLVNWDTGHIDKCVIKSCTGSKEVRKYWFRNMSVDAPLTFISEL